MTYKIGSKTITVRVNDGAMHDRDYWDETHSIYTLEEVLPSGHKLEVFSSFHYDEIQKKKKELEDLLNGNIVWG